MELKIHFLPEAGDFCDTLDKKTRDKVFHNIDKTILGFKGEWFEKLRGTHDLWEFRTLYNQQCVRLLAFWDKRKKGNPTLIVCTHGFLKTTAKTPQAELEYAASIKEQYFLLTK